MPERHGTGGDDRMLFQPYLERGEKVLWTGRPQLDWRKIIYKVFWVSIGCAVVGFVIFLRSQHGPLTGLAETEIARTESYLGIAMLFGLAALAFAVLTVALRLIWPRRISYLLSDRRAMALDRSSGKLMKAVSLGEVDQLDQFLESDGSGTLIFDYDVTRSEKDGRTRATPKLKFADIEAVAAVHALAEEAALKLLAKADEARP